VFTVALGDIGVAIMRVSWVGFRLITGMLVVLLVVVVRVGVEVDWVGVLVVVLVLEFEEFVVEFLVLFFN
jgi:hypothetical protein